MIPRKSDTPHVPITPSEIAEDARLAREAGASIIHLHAREDDGEPTYRKALYAEIIAKVREVADDLIICVSCSGRNFKEFAQRSEVLELEGDVKPEMASLTLGSLNFPKTASVNTPQMIQDLAQKMNDNGIVPELEVFNIGMVDYSQFMIRKGMLKPPFYYNILLGSLGTLSATPLNLVTTVNALPAGSVWAATGIGRFQFNMNALAVMMGGNVRIGLEDNLYMDLDKAELATNAALIERVANLSRAAGRQVATPDEARAIIGIPQRVANVGS